MKFTKYLIVKKENINDKNIPKIFILKKSKLFILYKFRMLNRVTEVKTGIDRKKDILAESFLS